MKTVAALLALFSLAVTACAPEGELTDTALPGPPFRFNVTALTAEQQDWLAESADEINTGTGRELIVLDPQGPHSVAIGPSDGSWNGWTTCNPFCKITFRDDVIWQHDWPVPGGGFNCPIYDMRKTGTHEFLHALDVHFPDNLSDPVHSLNPDSIMHLPSPWCGRATAADFAAIGY